MALPDMQAALHHFPDLEDLAQILLDVWQPDAGPVHLPDGPLLTVILGDARKTVPAWADDADAWYLDGFSPAKNPALWEAALLHAVADHTTLGGTAATYSAAGHVRQSLTQAGFVVERTPGFGRKRHMTQARKPDAE